MEIAASGDEQLPEAQERAVLFRQTPVEPTDLIVLAVGVVVAFLRAANLVAGHEHRHAARHHENDGEVLDLPFPQRLDGWIVGWAFAAAVPAQVFVDAVAVTLAVGVVVLVVVGDQVVEREAVVASNEVDTIDGEMAAGLVYVGAAG